MTTLTYRPPPEPAPPYGRYAVAWAGLAVLGVANGALRTALLEEPLGEEWANRASVATLIAFVVAYTWILEGRRPLASARAAWVVGGVWAALTVGFELGFGHWVVGDSWRSLAEQYDVSAGRLWPLVPTAILLAPAAVRRLRRR